MPSSYSQIPNQDLPPLPPSYEDVNDARAPMLENANNGNHENGHSDSDSMSDLEANISFQEFEIDDPNNNIYTSRQSLFSNSRNFLQRANSVSRSIRNGISSKIFVPMTRMFDPIADIWRRILIKFDVLLGKVGNPLIIKRFLYVFFISSVIYLIITSGLYPTNKALINGQFNDQETLLKFIKSHVDAKGMEESLEYLSSIPHMAGTAGDLALARYVNHMYSDSRISPKEFNEEKSFVNYPDVAKFELRSDDKDIKSFEAKLVENVPTEDQKRSVEKEEKDGNGNTASTLPMRSFNFLSADGSVEGPIVYVNYGRNKDFKYLQDHKVNFNEAICLVRYGKISASSKLKVATNKGCGAVVYFKDPNYLDLSTDEDRNVVEKQSVSLPEYSSGDVLTPGWPSIDSNPRIPWDQSETAPKIPSIPVSYNNILPFLKALVNQGVKIDTSSHSDWKFSNEKMVSELGTSDVWAGSDNIKKFKGLVLVKTTKRESKPLWNIVGKISGVEQTERAVIIGAQRDAACFGAVNPNTGTTILLELLKLFTTLQKKYNWEPLRSIYFISIDGTEYNYAGITEWIEERFREIRKEAYAYIDLSDAVNGDELRIKTHPVFESVILEVLKKVDVPNQKDPNKNKNGNNDNPKLDTVFKSENFQTFNDFGNFYPFTSFVGIPSIEAKFADSSEPKDQYTSKYPKNSCFDSFKRFQNSKVDPNMDHHRALVEIISTLVVRLIDDPLIPYSLDKLYDKINSYVDDVEEYGSKISSDFHKGKTLDFSVLRQSNEYLKKIGVEFANWLNTWTQIVRQESGGLEPSILSARRWDWNSKLIYLQRFSVVDGGINDRPWIKNMLFAPQFNEPEVFRDEGSERKFQWWTFPSIRDAVEKSDWRVAQEEIQKFADLVKESSFNVMNA